MIINEELLRQRLLAEIKELNLNTLKEYFIKEYSHSLNEMAKINTKEFY